ncbi:MAG: DEAD/DEAH box helicase family protein, partial [Spirochaetales bacterium]|nr:DEAD/DEAH box helicase family protein [Spirochaetales bacterium]
MSSFFSITTNMDGKLVIPDVDYGTDDDMLSIPRSPETTCKSADEALIMSINRNGTVDLRFMSEISGLPTTSLISELAGKAIFQDPAVFEVEKTWSPDQEWLLAPQYLCGNIPAKLARATRMEGKFPGCFQWNVNALRKLMPPTLGMEDIHVSLGAMWIPASIYAQFIRSLLRLPCYPEVVYQKELSRWMIQVKDAGHNSVLNKVIYGTEDLPALKIIEQTMNARNVKVYDYEYSSRIGDMERVLNRSKTLAAQDKQKKIIREFEAWVLEDEARRTYLQECYNDTFVGYCTTPYDGSFLTLPGLNPAVHLYDHQKNAIARILLSKGNLLLAHDVGTGKTFEMVVSAHELHRMGLSKKTLLVVLNSVLGATVASHKRLYPEDDILAVFPKDFTPKKRVRMLERIRDEEHVCIYMAYSSFDMVRMSKSYYVRKKVGEIADLRAAAANASTKREKNALEAEAKRLNKKLSDYVVRGEEAPWLAFDELVVDTLYVDEA